MIALFVAHWFGWDMAALASLPMFALTDSGCGESDSGSCGDAGCDSGGDGGGSCGCNSAGCDTSSDSTSSGCGDGGGGGESVTSTPYLYIKERDGNFRMLNDVMIGTPVTRVKNRAEGERRIAVGDIGQDVYPVSLENIDNTTPIVLKLKEIEPEETFLYSVSAHTHALSPDQRLLQDWTHRKGYTVNRTSVVPFVGEVLKNYIYDCSRQLNLPSQASWDKEKLHSVRLERGDTLTFKVFKAHTGQQALVLGSFWRDFFPTTKDVAAQISQSYRWGLSRAFYRASMTLAVFGSFFFGTTHVPDEHQDNQLLSFMQKCNGVHVAHADVPHYSGGEGGASLNISYKHHITGGWVHFATVQPRVYLPEEELISLPSEAFGKDGFADVKIEATKRHYVKSLAILSEPAEEVIPEEGITPKVSHVRAGTIKEVTLTDPIHLVAGDELFLTFSPQPGRSHLLLELHGFYTPLSLEGQKIAGAWEQTRTAHEEDLIANMYPTT